MSTNEQAARDEAEKRTRPRGSRPGNDASYVDGFVRGALWAESALLARLSDPDDALAEAAARTFVGTRLKTIDEVALDDPGVRYPDRYFGNYTMADQFDSPGWEDGTTADRDLIVAARNELVPLLDRLEAAEAKVARAEALAEEWDEAKNLGTSQPNVVARAFASSLRAALAGDPR